jgi:DNA uptake protein ComE-like DNA-binding protein
MGPVTHRLKPLLAILIAFAALAPPAAIPQAPPQNHAIPEAQRVDINHAGLEELLKVPGMTNPWAARIIRFRPYRNKQELLDRGIVSAEVYSRIKEYIVAHRKNTDQ